jgi:D-alanyl-D-alanine-carboxypeptidase/D-alanyl-D-alanine-endopeptidase
MTSSPFIRTPKQSACAQGHSRAAVCLAVLVLFGVLSAAAAEGQRRLKEHASSLAKDYLSNRTHGALVIGVVQNGKAFSAGFGRVSSTNAAAPDAATVFEIGSITKVFTGILLAQMQLDGRVTLDDPIARHLPSGFALPDALHPVTLTHLSTHTAGLPRLPANLDLSGPRAVNPYARYTAADLHTALRATKPARAPGAGYDYSNYGTALLGHLLERRAGRPYAELLAEHICTPLEMTDTVLTLNKSQRHRLTPGHSPRGAVVPNWDFDAFAPAGGLRSCVGDLLKFMQVNLATNSAAPGPALVLAQQSRFKSGTMEMGLGWHIQGGRRLWHNGGTGGYASFLALDRTRGTGVVLLSNYGDAMARDASLDRMGMELLKLAGQVAWE